MVHSSPAPSGREARRSQTEADIVDVALRMLEAEGVDALTMKSVASEVGYAVGALYRYFPSKDALLLAVQHKLLAKLADDIAVVVERMRAQAAKEQWSVQQRALACLCCAYSVYAAWPTREPVHFAVLSRWLGEPRLLVDTEVALPRVPALLALFAPVLQLVEDAVTSHALAPTTSPARALVTTWGALQGVLQLGKLARFEPTFDTAPLVRDTLRALLVGQGANPIVVDDSLRRAAKLVKKEQKS